jgi:hypothetical protein
LVFRLPALPVQALVSEQLARQLARLDLVLALLVEQLLVRLVQQAQQLELLVQPVLLVLLAALDLQLVLVFGYPLIKFTPLQFK